MSAGDATRGSGWETPLRGASWESRSEKDGDCGESSRV